MITAWSGIARPIRNSQLVQRRKRPEPPRTMANAAMKEISTAGRIVPSVTTTLLTK
jgi:hypothetical protein